MGDHGQVPFHLGPWLPISAPPHHRDKKFTPLRLVNTPGRKKVRCLFPRAENPARLVDEFHSLKNRLARDTFLQ